MISAAWMFARLGDRVCVYVVCAVLREEHSAKYQAAMYTCYCCHLRSTKLFEINIQRFFFFIREKKTKFIGMNRWPCVGVWQLSDCSHVCQQSWWRLYDYKLRSKSIVWMLRHWHHYFYHFQIPGLIVEPLLFVLVGYWLSGMRPTLYAFSMTTFVAIMVMNVSTACGKYLL